MTEPTTCPVEECGDIVDYTVLYDHLYGDHDASELCATVANLVAENDLQDKAMAAMRGSLSQQLADILEQRNPDRCADFSEGVDWCISELRATATSKQ